MAAASTEATDATETSLPYEGCGWAWAEQDLPKITSAFQASLTEAGLSFDPEETYAYAFGENCLRPDGTVDHFVTLETDFAVTTTQPNPKDLAALGDFGGAVLQIVLSDFDAGTVPGTSRGYVTFVFIADGAANHHQVSLVDAAAALEKGLAGADLYRSVSLISLDSRARSTYTRV
jgi:hypothetical protein